MANLGLPDAVDATEALLDPVRIPRQVVIYHQVGSLQVNAFARRIRREKDLHFLIVTKRFLDFQTLLAADPAMNRHHTGRISEQRRNTMLEVI